MPADAGFLLSATVEVGTTGAAAAAKVGMAAAPNGATNGPTNKVCRGKSVAGMGGKAHGALRNCSPQTVALVPLHRGFDELIMAGAQRRQRFGID